MTTVYVLASATVRMWVSDLSRGLGGRRRVYGLLFALFLLAGAWAGFGHRVAVGGLPPLDRAEAAAYAGPMAVITVLLAAMSAVLVTMYTPPRSVMDFMVALLPVARWQRVLATDYLIVAVSAGFAVVALLPLVRPVFAAGGPPLWAPFGGALSLLAVGGALLGRGLVTLTASLLTVLARRALPAAIHQFAGAMTLLALFGGLFGSMSDLGTGTTVRTPGDLPRVLIEGVVDGSQGLAMLGVVGLALCIAAFSHAVAAAYAVLASGNLERPGRKWRLLRSSRAGQSLAWLEFVQWIRFPSNAATMALLSSIAIYALVLRADNTDAAFTSMMFILLLAVASTFGVGSYGATRAHHWIYQTTGNPHAWIAPKVVSLLVLWLVTLSVLSLLLATRTAWNPLDDAWLLPVFAVELAVGAVIGLLLPVTSEQNLGSALSEGAALLASVLVVFIVPQLPFVGTSPTALISFCVVLTALLGYAYLRIARTRHHQMIAVA